MWSIMDSDAPLVADEVYAQLFKYSEPDPTQVIYDESPFFSCSTILISIIM